MTESLEYRKTYVVHVYDIASNEYLAIHSLFNYLQDIASEHATRLRFGRDDLMKDNRFWVLSRIYARISRWPGWEEKLTIATWPRGTDRLFALRDFSISDEKGGHIASATSSWLVVDKETRRVQRPDSLLTHLQKDLPEGQATGRNAGKIDAPSGKIHEEPAFPVRHSDIDMNLHVNNVNYLRWVTDCYNSSFYRKYMPSSVEINYLAEALPGDRVIIRHSMDESSHVSSTHSLVREEDNTELCRIRIEWKDCDS
ncbi:MAG: thioesterase [Bacteroidales bacterium]